MLDLVYGIRQRNDESRWARRFSSVQRVHVQQQSSQVWSQTATDTFAGKQSYNSLDNADPSRDSCRKRFPCNGSEEPSSSLWSLQGSPRNFLAQRWDAGDQHHWQIPTALFWRYSRFPHDSNTLSSHRLPPWSFERNGRFRRYWSFSKSWSKKEENLLGVSRETCWKAITLHFHAFCKHVVLAYGSLKSDIIVGHVSPWLANECQASVLFTTHWFLMFDFLILHLNWLTI